MWRHLLAETRHGGKLNKELEIDSSGWLRKESAVWVSRKKWKRDYLEKKSKIMFLKADTQNSET